MSCPTCSHTMHNVLEDNVTRICWCPRCGTLKRVAMIGDDEPSDEPLLSQRVRSFVMGLDASDDLQHPLLADLHRTGIIESCLLPGCRPKVQP